ncbi:MAG: virulence RhuM family protein [Holophagae bacterium]|nr:virulence RhuM family protein [Holophagae bacterium]
MPDRKVVKVRVGRSVACEPATSYCGPAGEVVLFEVPDGSVELRIWLERDALWLSQRQMSLLSAKDTDTIGLHRRNIYRDGELDEAATTGEFSVVQAEGTRQVRRRVRLFNLDAVISVGYRVNSKRGTQLRIWATRVPREHVHRGYTVNERRLTELKQAARLVADMSERATLGSDKASAGNAGASWLTSKVAGLR